MFYREHAPQHLHARFRDQEIRVNIQTGEMMTGQFPFRARHPVLEWLELHREELMQDWRLAQERKSLNPIEPLD